MLRLAASSSLQYAAALPAWRRASPTGQQAAATCFASVCIATEAFKITQVNRRTSVKSLLCDPSVALHTLRIVSLLHRRPELQSRGELHCGKLADTFGV